MCVPPVSSCCRGGQAASAPDRPLRVAFLGYRDIKDAQRFVTVPFTEANDITAFKSQVS